MYINVNFSYFFLALVLYLLHRRSEGRSTPLWLLPLVLLVRSWRIRDAWNALLVWRAEGKGLGLWPEG